MVIRCASCQTSFLRKTGIAGCVVLLAAVWPTLGEGPAESGKGAEPAKRVSQGRLPPHFNAVVSEQQRQEIYQLQATYRVRIKELEKRINALRDELDTRIAGVLTDEQRQKIRASGGKVAEPKHKTPLSAMHKKKVAETEPTESKNVSSSKGATSEKEDSDKADPQTSPTIEKSSEGTTRAALDEPSA